MDFIRRHIKKILVVITVLLIAVMLLSYSFKDRTGFLEDSLGFIITPMQKVSTNISISIGELFGQNRDIDLLNEENKKLIQENSELKDENKRLMLLKKENDELNKLLKMNEKYPDYEKLGAQIISNGTSNWYNIFEIDRGSKDGVEPDMFVVAEGGLVGKIFEVGYNYSKVTVITDERSAFHAKSKQTEDIGVVKGNALLMKSTLCRMEYIDLYAEISEGDEIITSSFSLYPAGLTIGYVKEVGIEPDGLTKYAIIEPAVDLKHLNKVLIVMHKPEEGIKN